MTQPLQALTAAEARKLSGFLRSKKSPAGTLSFNQLKGYLFSICCTPALLQPSFWLPEVFGGEMPAFEREQDFWVIEAVMKLYNQVSNEVLEGNPKLPANCKVAAEVGENFKPGSALHEWSCGFDMGLTLVMNVWDEFPLPRELEEEIECYWMLLSFFADEQRARAAKIDDQKSPPFEVMLKTVREQLPWLIKDYATIGRMLYEVTLDDMWDEGQLPLALQEEELIDDTVIPILRNTPDYNGDDLINAVYDAEPAEKIRLAREVLQQNPESVDAYLILADWAAGSEQERKRYLEQAVAAGEKGLGEAYFRENTGYFWGIRETRPYMTALAGLAEACRQCRERSRAISLYEKGLELNLNDNQALRYPLLTLYLEQNLLEKAEALFDQYEEEGSAFFRYGRVLAAYIQEGASENTNRLKRDAKEYNRYVPKLLAGHVKMPTELPDYYGIGDKNEAVLYVLESRNLWRQVMGSIPWLLKK